MEQIAINCSIGITTGNIFCGTTVGSTTRHEYAMVGDIVNLSARLMVAASEKQSQNILVDFSTYQSASRFIQFKFLGEIAVKGKALPIPIYYPTAKVTQYTQTPHIKVFIQIRRTLNNRKFN